MGLSWLGLVVIYNHRASFVQAFQNVRSACRVKRGWREEEVEGG